MQTEGLKVLETNNAKSTIFDNIARSREGEIP